METGESFRVSIDSLVESEDIMRHVKPRSSPAHAPCGFTLWELLLSTAISAGMIGAYLGAMNVAEASSSLLMREDRAVARLTAAARERIRSLEATTNLSSFDVTAQTDLCAMPGKPCVQEAILEDVAYAPE